MQPTAPVQDWGQAMMSSATSALGLFAGAIPKFFAFVVILIVGWLIAAVVAGVVGGVLRGMKFNDLADRSGFSDFVRQMGLRSDASGFIAQVARWFIRLITLIVAFDALGLPAVSQVLQQMLLWLPNAAVALAILVIGGGGARGAGGSGGWRWRWGWRSGWAAARRLPRSCAAGTPRANGPLSGQDAD